MAKRFVRVDLSDTARDFRPIALEPGLPLLDQSSSNARILFRWLGGLIAEPAWEGEAVEFYARDDHGGRLEDVVCQTASPEDLKGLLKDDVAALKDRLEKAKPETPTERALKKTVWRTLTELVDNPNRTDIDDYFFRYRDLNGRWRLVWCWGYQRVDQEPAPAVVCTDPECSLLFVRRAKQSPKCPACAKALAARPKKRRYWRRSLVPLLLLLLLLLAGYYWWTHPARLIAEPSQWAGPVGGRIEFKVLKAGLFSKQDVTGQAVPIVRDPQIARLDALDNAAVALSPGQTIVRFHLGNLQCESALAVGVAKNPEKLIVEPRSVELGIGTTARLKVTGKYGDGSTADLTETAQWAVEKENVVFAYGGLLEGISEGTSAVTAKYRATPDSPWIDASTTVSVAKLDFKSLEVAIAPKPLSIGRASRLEIDAVTDEGKKYSVLESSLLTADVSPPYVASVQGRHLRGEHVGKGKLAVTFGDQLSGGDDFEVVVGSGIDRLTVAPEKLNLVVGEIADLSVASPLADPIKLASSKPAVVEITAERRLIGRSEGSAQIDVVQGAEKRSVDVTVTKADIKSIALEPNRLVVPVDDTVRARVMGRLADGREVEMAPDLVTADKTPSPRFADYDAVRVALHGVRPTEASAPQTLAVRLGANTASAPVEVVVAPLRLTIAPPGPIDLPLGQMMRLHGWATYSGGRRVMLAANRLDWQADEAPNPGLELRGNKVAALKAGGGPLPVFASYFGRSSNRVLFKSVAPGPVTLRLDVDRPLRLAGETGAAVLSASGPNGDVELVPEMATFQSSETGVLAVDEKSGVFRAVAPGKATITATHAAATAPATLGLSVYDPAKARLVFQPNSVKLAVDEVARLPLYLEVQDGEKTERVPMVGPGVGYSMTQPQAIRWQPPALTGLSPSKPFELTASYAPIMSSTATATIEVVAAGEIDGVRVVPSSAELAAGQTLALRVEALRAGVGDQWKEVRPDAVAWTVPPGPIWSPPSDDLRPALTVADGASGSYQLQAEYGGKRAMAEIAIKPEPPDAAGAKLVLVREPEGEFLAVGHQQRYTVMIDKGGTLTSAANVRWPDNFENEYVRWQAPVLTAKQGGYEQRLRAEIGGRAVLWRTFTYEPAKFERAAPRADQPVAVKILSDQITGPGQVVRFAVGAEFDDFRVEAHYADGFTRLVTKKALLRTPESADKAPLTPSGGRLIGVRPGPTTVSAEFDGVASQQPLPVEVVAALDVDQIRIAPAPITMLPGETLALRAIGYKGGKSVGDITGIGKLNWQSSNPRVAQVTGPAVTGAGLGQASVTASLGAIQSQPAPVDVVDSIGEALKAEPKILRLRVGESARVGTDVAVLRGELDVGQQVTVSPVQPDVVRYVPETRALVGVSPGVSAVALAYGDKIANLTVEVQGGLAPIDGTVYVEPASGTLAPGQALDLRAYVVTPDGSRIDRTASAVFTSSNPALVKFIGNKACAVATGTAQLTAMLAGTNQTGAAVLNVTNEEIDALQPDPPRLDLAVGDTVPLRVLGHAPSGTHELYPQPDLVLTPGGPSAAAIRIAGGSEVSAVAEGQSSVGINWKNKLSQAVPVSVTNSPWTGLAITPAAATLSPGQATAYQVTAMRGGQVRVLGPEDGVQLFTANQDVAQPIGPMTVQAKNPGRTTVVAQLGNQRAEAALNVVEGGNLVGVPGGVVGGVPTGYVVDPDQVRYRGGRWIGGRWVEPGGVVGVGPGVVGTVPAGPAAGLRFVPDVLRLAPNAPPAPVRVFEVAADGALGREVTADPTLELTEPPDFVKVEKTPAGPTLRPTAVGQTRVGARLGTLTADPLLVSVGDAMAGLARLEATPDPLVIWSGEQGTFAAVRVNPGGGQPPIAVDYKLTPAPNQGVLAAVGDKVLRGLSNGVAQVTVTTTDPAYNGLSTVASVQVVGAEQIAIEPKEVSLQIGQSTPPMQVMATAADGTTYQVAATLVSEDPNVLAPDPLVPGRFVARALGETQVRGEYRGRSAFAKVVVAGKRFEDVKTSDPMESGPNQFEITIEVLAAASEGPLEYRVYAAGQAPAETWVPAQTQGDRLQATLRSPPMLYGPRGSMYQLMIEARSPGGGAAQQYPLTFRLSEKTERLNSPNK